MLPKMYLVPPSDAFVGGGFKNSAKGEYVHFVSPRLQSLFLDDVVVNVLMHYMYVVISLCVL